MLFPHEEEAAIEFIKTHRCKKGAERNTMKLFVSWAGGIGRAYDVECPVCGRTKDVTDYAKW